MRVLICGSRGWRDRDAIDYLISRLATRGEGHEELTVIHGHAPKGADRLADEVARQWGAEVIREPADWKRYGRGAGPIRNKKMLTDHDPDVVVAFRSSGKSNGTDDMVAQAKDFGVQTHVLTDTSTAQELDAAVEAILTHVQTLN